MRTNDLIHALVNDNDSPRQSIEVAFAKAMVPAMAMSVAIYWITLGPRPTLFADLALPRVSLKIVEMAFLAVAAVFLALKLARPGIPTRAAGAALLIGPAVLVASIIMELYVINPNQWHANLVGNNALACLLSIPLLSLPLLLASFYAMRVGAPTRLRLTGAVAGLLAGGLGATLYATHCPDDSPLFVATWYVIAIAFVVGIGAIAAPRVLRW